MKDRTVLRLIISFLLTLYVLQGVIIGIITTVPWYLASRNPQWKDQGIFNFAFYPFALKLAWAPFIDACYISRLGRRKSWLVPIQLLISLTLFLLSFHFSMLIEQGQVKLLTCIFLFVYFLLACQDICVDGWALTLLADFNLQWASTCQTVGQTVGRLIGSNLLMTFESANFTNEYVRKLLSLSQSSTGLFTLEQFVRFWAIAFLGVTIWVIIFPRDEKNVEHPSLIQTYTSIIKLFKKKCIQQLTFLFLISPLGYAATYGMTNLVLKRYGVTQHAIGLIGIPLVLAKIIVPFSVTQTKRPLTLYYYAYLPRLIMCLLIAVYIYYTPSMLNKIYFYPLLILLFIVNEALIYLMLVCRVGFYARISDPTIGGTYITLCSTLGNLGASISLSAVYYVAEWIKLPNLDYPLLVAVCFVLGVIWMWAVHGTLMRLQKIPLAKWHLSTPGLETHCTDDKDGDDDANVRERFAVMGKRSTLGDQQQAAEELSKPFM